MVVREHSSFSSPDGPVRTCVGCRKRAVAPQLLRVVVIEQESGLAVAPDPRRRAPGRGAHLHPTPECLELAVRRRAFPRALRVKDRLASELVQNYVQAATNLTEIDREEDGAAAHEHSMSTSR